MRKFVIVVDAQRDFMDVNGALYVPEAEKCVSKINNYLSSLDPKEVRGVLFTFDTHKEQSYINSEEAKLFPPHCLKGTTGWNLSVNPRLLDTSINVFKLEKNVFDMWEEPSLKLENTLYEYDRDFFFNNLAVDEIEVVGVAADYCVNFAIKGLVERRFKILIPNKELTQGIDRQIEQVVSEDYNPGLVKIK